MDDIVDTHEGGGGDFFVRCTRARGGGDPAWGGRHDDIPSPFLRVSTHTEGATIFLFVHIMMPFRTKTKEMSEGWDWWGMRASVPNISFVQGPTVIVHNTVKS